MSHVTVIRNARHWKTGEPIDLAFQRGVILEGAPASADVTVDAGGAILSPGLVDLHVHLREPGQGSRETIETGTRAAAAGGFTAVACMPNTEPVVDNIAWVEWVRTRARAMASCRVLPIAAVTIGQKGERLTEMIALKQAGAVALSDDGHPIVSAATCHAGLPIVCHEEDPALKGDGHMNEGTLATRLGIRGIPAAAESVMVRRDVELAELTGGRVHLAHLSCSASFEGLREAKRRGLAVTGETCPHYWMLTEDAVAERGTAAKMNPPLRTERDRAATIAAIQDGTIDCLATDHAPHGEDDKRQPFEMAPFGIVGLETALALTITGLVRAGHVTLPWALQLWTEGPRRVFHLPEVRLAAGFPADLTLIDAEREWVVDPEAFHSKGRSTPFAGMRVTGRALATWCAGELTHADPSLPIAGRRSEREGAALA
ncbi:MAG: dihydroorotase [Candidatus Eisenbacteria bacterium]|uniref:Dihydroorotase n=1 Tax=Eiseniibacteriota bacterium TaxID=2212470 RepID=A0A9D6LAP4_UNCEI|nr:dihydroorotase [Candidatus Eisenbacteria bacterium]